ncbi:MAG: methyltransferase [Thermosphaera sp.]
MGKLCVSIDKRRAEEAITLLRRKGLIDEKYLIERAGDKVLIPVVNTPECLKNISFEIVECDPRIKESRVKPPSHDIVGNVAILRSKVLETMDPRDVVETLRCTYPRLRAIYVKEETVEDFRVPVLKLLWGEPAEEVVAREYGLSFRVRLGKVYFNPRLAEEHRRIASMVRDGEVVVDLFSGIGGFPIHIASQRFSLIIANDLNPDAYELMVENIVLNKKRLKGFIIPFNNDAAEIPGILGRREAANRVIANLPKRSLDFAETYSTLLAPGGFLHLYVLTRDVEGTAEEVVSLLPEWRIMGKRLVLEYSPGAGIYRFDLFKP